jgi:hypothetical protein
MELSSAQGERIQAVEAAITKLYVVHGKSANSGISKK